MSTIGRSRRRTAVDPQSTAYCLELGAKVGVQPTIEERIDAGGAERKGFQQEIGRLEVWTSHEAVVDFCDERKEVPRRPADEKERDNGHQDAIGVEPTRVALAPYRSCLQSDVDPVVQHGRYEEWHAELEGERQDTVADPRFDVRPVLDAVVPVDVKVGVAERGNAREEDYRR